MVDTIEIVGAFATPYEEGVLQRATPGAPGKRRARTSERRSVSRARYDRLFDGCCDCPAGAGRRHIDVAHGVGRHHGEGVLAEGEAGIGRRRGAGREGSAVELALEG